MSAQSHNELNPLDLHLPCFPRNCLCSRLNKSSGRINLNLGAKFEQFSKLMASIGTEHAIWTVEFCLT